MKRRSISVPEFLGWFLISVACTATAILITTTITEVFHR